MCDMRTIPGGDPDNARDHDRQHCDLPCLSDHNSQ
jgi:hypothetical protein